MFEHLLSALRSHQTPPAEEHSGQSVPSEDTASRSLFDSALLSPEAVADLLRHVGEVAARIYEVPFALIVTADEPGGAAAKWMGTGAEHITRLSPTLLEVLLDPQLPATVVRDVRSEGRWKRHRLAQGLAEVEFADDHDSRVRFCAVAPLTVEKENLTLRGALLLLDERSHPAWNDAQMATLCDLAALAARAVSALISSPPVPHAQPEPAAPTPDNEEELREENRRAEESLRDSERLFRSVVQTAGEAIVLSDATGKIISWNEGATRMFGFREEAVRGRMIGELLSPGASGRRDELERLRQDLVRRAGEASPSKYSSAPSAVFEANGRRSVGGEFPVEIALSVWRGEQNTYVSAFMRDVSARHTAERVRALSHAVARILAESPSLDEAAGGILRAIGESQKWSTGALWLIKRAPGAGGPVLRCAQVWTQHNVEVRELEVVRRQSSYACGVGLPGRVWAAGEPFWIEDIARDPHISRSSAIARDRLQTAFGFPIRFGHEVLGVIDLYSHDLLPIDANFVEAAAGFGSQIGQFIVRKQAESEIRARAHQQAAVARLGQRALSRLDVDALLNEAAAMVTATLAVDVCSILELLPEQQVLRSRATVGGRPGTLGEIGIAADATTQAGWTLLASEPVIVDDYRTESRFSPIPSLEAAGAVSGVSVIIPGTERPFGVLLAYVAHERQFTADDAHFLELVSNVVGAALERDRNEAALQRAREDAENARIEAERANKAKSDFLSRMSHELRTPLNAILGFTQLLDMDELQPEQDECVRHISQGGDHLLKLINEVLEISRIEAGRITFSLEAISPGPLAREALNFIAPLAAQRRITLDFVESPVWKSQVCADQQRLHEILLNLLSNAVKYNREGGKIRLSCAQGSENRLRIIVSDTGPGIAAELIPRLFDPFERVGAEKTKVEGTGLGLALAKSLIEAMDGRIGVMSAHGKGSDFWLEIPLWGREREDDTLQFVATAPELASVPDTLEGSVLYIEDNAANMVLVQRLLAKHSRVRLLSAASGEEGLALAREEQPDLILLDMHLPDMTGSEVLRRLSELENARNIPVVVVTADASPAQRDKMLGAGARDYIVKPLNVQSLLRILQTMLRPVN